jgi:hypothetical protein
VTAMTKAGPEHVAIKAAMAVAKDVAEGRVVPAQLDAAALEACRSLFAAVVGPDDPLWPLQAEVARQVIAQGGVTANELSEWLAVQRRREGPRPDCWIEKLLAALAEEPPFVEAQLRDVSPELVALMQPGHCHECLAGVCTEHEGGVRWAAANPEGV